MSQIEAKGLFRLLRGPLYRYKISRAMRMNTRSIGPGNGVSTLMLITSSDSDQASLELRFTRANSSAVPYDKVVFVAPTAAWNALDHLPAHWQGLTYTQELATRSGLPGSELIEQVRSHQTDVCALLPWEEDMFATLLFVHGQSPHKVAFHRDDKPDCANLMVTPADSHDKQARLHHMYKTMTTFLPTGNSG